MTLQTDKEFTAAVLGDLRGIPEQVVHQWLTAHREGQDWPPPLDSNGNGEGRWFNLLACETIHFWRSARWSDRPIAIPILNSLKYDSQVGVFRTARGMVSGGRQRILGIMGAITGGLLPLSPVLLRVGDEYEILDGFHRVAALMLAPGANVLVQSKQPAWVAEPGT